MELTIETEKIQRNNQTIAILKISGQINQDNLPTLESAVQNIFENGIGRLVLDMQKVTGMTSSAFGLLINITNHPNAQSGICLINVQDKFRTLFDLLGLGERIHILDTKNKALEYWG